MEVVTVVQCARVTVVAQCRHDGVQMWSRRSYNVSPSSYNVVTTLYDRRAWVPSCACQCGKFAKWGIVIYVYINSPHAPWSCGMGGMIPHLADFPCSCDFMTKFVACSLIRPMLSPWSANVVTTVSKSGHHGAQMVHHSHTH